MKRKLTLVVCVIALFALIFTLASCGGDNTNDDHTHTYAQEWSSDADGHWYKATCECGDTSNYGAHVDGNDDGVCDTCKYVMCAHAFDQAWENDATNHWHKATCEHTNVKGSLGTHADTNKDGNCDTCAYVMCAHTYADAYSSDANNHWYAPTCGCVIANKGEEKHTGTEDGVCDKCEYVVCEHKIDENKDGVCDECEYQYCNHTYAETLTSDANNHWYAPTCGCEVAGKDVTPHVPVVGETSTACKDCQYVICVHEFETTYSSDKAYHWYEATCDCDVVKDKAAHTDDNNDGVCEICNGEVCAHEFETELTSDATGHWYAPTCECDVKKDFAKHVDVADDVVDGICDVCSYVICEEHTFAEVFDANAEGHWYASTCGCDIVSGKAEHADENKDGLCDACEWTVCEHEYATEWSSDENNHWYASTCGCYVSSALAAHDAATCTVCGYTSAVKPVVDALDSLASDSTNDTTVVTNETDESYVKYYDNYTVVADAYGNVRYYSYYGENGENLFVVVVNSDGASSDPNAEDPIPYSYNAIYWTIQASNHEDFIKALYAFGNGEQAFGTSYAQTSAYDEATGKYSFSYIYVEETTAIVVEVEFTVDTTVNGIASANVVATYYDISDIDLNAANSKYTVADGAVATQTETYAITQAFGEPMDSTDAPNPYPAEDYIVTGDFTVSVDDTAYADGDTITLDADTEIQIYFDETIASKLSFNEVTTEITLADGSSLQYGYVSSYYSSYSDPKYIYFKGIKAGEYVLTITVGEAVLALNININYKAPTTIGSAAYDEDGEKVVTDNYTMYMGDELVIDSSVSAGYDPAFTATLPAGAAAALTDNEDGTYTFKPVMVGTYEITITSTVSEGVSTVLTVEVVTPPAISEILSGEHTGSNVYTGMDVGATFTPASEGAENGTVVITVNGETYNWQTGFVQVNYSATYTYAYNSETNAVDLTYTEGDEFDVEFIVENYKVVAIYSYNEYKLVQQVVEPEIPTGDPTESPITVTITETYNYDYKFTFVAGDAGYYKFTVPEGVGVISESAYKNFGSAYVDFQMDNGGTFTLQLEAGETVDLRFGSIEATGYEITFTYSVTDPDAGEDETTVTGLEGTYTAADDFNNTFDVVITNETITFTPAGGTEAISYTYEYVNGQAIYFDSFGIQVTMGMQFSLTITDGAVTGMTYNGNGYTLTKQESSSEDDETTTTITGNGSEETPFIVAGAGSTMISAGTWNPLFVQVNAGVTATLPAGAQFYTDPTDLSTAVGATVTPTENTLYYVYADSMAGCMGMLTATVGGSTGGANDGLVVGENEVKVTVTNYFADATTVTFTATEAGTYTINAADGETNADVYITNGDWLELPYEFTLEAGETISFDVCSANVMTVTEDTINLVIAKAE